MNTADMVLGSDSWHLRQRQDGVAAAAAAGGSTPPTTTASGPPRLQPRRSRRGAARTLAPVESGVPVRLSTKVRSSATDAPRRIPRPSRGPGPRHALQARSAGQSQPPGSGTGWSCCWAHVDTRVAELVEGDLGCAVRRLTNRYGVCAGWSNGYRLTPRQSHVPSSARPTAALLLLSTATRYPRPRAADSAGHAAARTAGFPQRTTRPLGRYAATLLTTMSAAATTSAPTVSCPGLRRGERDCTRPSAPGLADRRPLRPLAPIVGVSTIDQVEQAWAG